MTILLTGATGFLGSHLLEKLLKLNYDVVVLKRSFSDTWRIEHLLNKVASYDIDKVDIKQPFRDHKTDVVIHTVTKYGRNQEPISEVVDTNLMFSLKLLETAVDFNTDTFFNTDTLLYKYLNHYSLSKKQFVEWLKFYSNKINVVNLKLEHIYGIKDDESKFVTWIVKQLLSDVEKIDLTEGEQKRDFIYIDDVVKAYILMLANLKNFQAFTEFDIGTGNQIELKEFILKVYNEIKRVKDINTKLNFGAIPYREGEFMEIKENVEPLYNLGWEPTVAIQKGINNIIKEQIDG